MANIKITDLTAYTDAASTDVLPIVDVTADVTKKIAIGDIVKAVPPGTGALPGLAFDGDPDTGLSSPDFNKLALSTAGTGRLFIDANGKVGIGVSNPSDYTNYANDLVITDPSGSATGISINITGSTGYSSVYFGDSDAGGAGAIQYGHFVDDVMYFTVGGNTRCAITSTGQIQSAGLGTAGTPAFSFSTDPNTGIYSPGADQVAISTNGTGRLFVDANGNVGVGAASPDAKLTLANPGQQIGITFKEVSTTRAFIEYDGTIPGIKTGTVGGANYLIYTNNTERLRITSTGEFEFTGAGSAGTTQAVYFSGSAPVNSLVIDSSGRVGLGTSDAQNLLSLGLGSGTTTRILGQYGNNVSTTLEVGAGQASTFRGGMRIAVTDTGAGSVGDSVVSFHTTKDGGGTVERLSIDQDGDINIDSGGVFYDATNNRLAVGTTSPALPLHVVGAIASRNTTAGMDNMSIQFVETGSGNAYGVRIGQKANATLAFEKYDGGWGETARIDSSGRLLVGTSSASVFTFGGVTPRFQVEGTDASAAAVVIARNSNDANGAGLIISKSRGTTAGSNTIVSNNDTIADIRFEAGDGTQKAIAGSIGCQVDGTPGANDMPGRLVFSTTADGASSPTERMRIDSSGKVGVGTTGPLAKLAVEYAVAGSGSDGIRLSDTTNTTVTLLGTTETTYSYAGVTGHSTLLYGSRDLAICADNANSGQIKFSTGGSEAMRVDASRRLLVGTTTTSAAPLTVNGTTEANGSLYRAVFGNGYLDADSTGASGGNGSEVQIQSASSARPAVLSLGGAQGNGEALGAITFFNSNNTDGKRLRAFIRSRQEGATVNEQGATLEFSTTADGASSPTERMRISNAGQLFSFSTDNTATVATSQAAGTTFILIRGRHSATTTINGTSVFYVYSNGNVENTNNSYGAISDIKLKENIVDASSQWDDIKALRPVNYNFKEGQTHTQLGLIAQEVELVSPGLVSESPDRDEDGNDLGTVTKSVNYSVLYMKAVKALQEAMERIETLEAKVAALETP